MSDSSAWWKSGVLYQIYPRSFNDTNDDGIGDIPGIVEKLDYLSWLGVNGVWINPITLSPNNDFGYDVTDYCKVQPEFGTLDDVTNLLTEARKRNIRVLFDMVPSHTSILHPWFVDSRSARDSKYRDWYVWRDPKPDGSPPTNWRSVPGGPAWTLDPTTEQMYMHNYLPEQPQLNWWNEDLRAEFERILRYWFDLGASGFRVDVCYHMLFDQEFRDNPPATPDDPQIIQEFGQRSTYNSDRPEVHEILRRWRAIADSYEDPKIFVGEAIVLDINRLVAYLGRDDEMNLVFNFPFFHSLFESKDLASIVQFSEDAMPPEDWPIWTGSNHDSHRFSTRWCDGDERKIRLALTMLLTMRGTTMLYMGDEIGLQDTPLADADRVDPFGLPGMADYPGRDGFRTPMPWENKPNGGFTDPTTRPWLPLGDTKVNVADQRQDQSSVLTMTRGLIALRASNHDLALGSYERIEAFDGVWAFKRGAKTTVALNFSDVTVEFPTPGNKVFSSRADDNQAADKLLPWEGAVFISP